MMETRIIIAYSLIAIMVGLVIFGAIMFSKKRDKARNRDSGRGGHL